MCGLSPFFRRIRRKLLHDHLVHLGPQSVRATRQILQRGMFAIGIAFGTPTSREEETLRAAGLGVGELLADADSVPAVAASESEAGGGGEGFKTNGAIGGGVNECCHGSVDMVFQCFLFTSSSQVVSGQWLQSSKEYYGPISRIIARTTRFGNSPKRVKLSI